jgi:hypothetical protein
MPGSWAGLFLEYGQGPAPAGQLPGDGHVGDHMTLAALTEGDPPGMQSPVTGVAACAGCRCGQFPAIVHGLAAT